MVAKQEFFRFTISSIVETSINGVRYHRETDPRLHHTSSGLIGPVSLEVLQFVRSYGLVRLLENSKYNVVLTYVLIYRIMYMDWKKVGEASLCSQPYLYYEWLSGVVHPVPETKVMEPVY